MFLVTVVERKRALNNFKQAMKGSSQEVTTLTVLASYSPNWTKGFTTDRRARQGRPTTPSGGRELDITVNSIHGYCYGLNCVPSKFICWSPNPITSECDLLQRQGHHRYNFFSDYLYLILIISLDSWFSHLICVFTTFHLMESWDFSWFTFFFNIFIGV